MAKYRQLHTDFWNDGFVLDLTPEEKYFYIYLMTNPNTTQCGIYELPKRIVETQTGYNRETVDKLLKRFEEYKKIKYSEETKEILIINWVKYNQPNNSNAIKCVNRELKNTKNREFVSMFFNQCVNQDLNVEDIFKGIGVKVEALKERELKNDSNYNENRTISNFYSGCEGAYKRLGSKEVISNKEEIINNKEEVEEINKEKGKEKTSVASYDVKDVIAFFKKNIYKPKDMEYKKIMNWVNSVSCDVIILAIEEAVQYNAKNIKYIESILKNWKKKGLSTKEEVIKYKKLWDKSICNSSKKSSSIWNLEDQRKYDFEDLEKKLLGWDKRGE